ncbi:excinuclease ABC subunit UvrC [Candidatus Peregrinibacteria bacterium]|nr:excinuclease ABC subunit UvrC [Candidatus Peregrinibacteria bacterium]
MSSKFTEHLLKNIPHLPGVYRMKSKDGEVIYIGKAKDLFKRVNSYFQNVKKHPPRTAKMVEQICDIDYTVTSSELEALMLETNLIKENRPKYNILMKDDKNFAYIKITTNEDYPRIQIVRKVLKDNAKYFGPKTTASKIYHTLTLLRKIFPYRNCNLEIEDLGAEQEQLFERKRKVKITKATIKYPCLDLHIKRCIAPCIGKPDLEEYRKLIQQIINFLEGKHQDIIEKLKTDMKAAADGKKFEQAAKIRDKILSIQSIFENQLVTSADHQNTDIINYFKQEESLYFIVFQIREGKLIDQQNVVSKSTLEKGPDQIISSFLQQFYSDNTNLPNEILLPEKPENQEILENWLTKLADHKVKLTIPQKGKKDKLLDLALENAFSFAKQSRARFEGELAVSRESALENLAQILGLSKTPKRLECYDISHLSGTHTVASMSVFENGFPKKDQYRHFKINLNTPGQPDDFASMEEVILRRLKYLKPSLETKGCKITKKKDQYVLKYNKNQLLAFKVIKSDKLKTFLEYFPTPKEKLDIIIKKIIEKFDCKRVYLQVDKKDLRKYEILGFQEVKITLSEYPENQNKRVAIVYDKTRNYEDPSFKKIPDLIIIDGGKGQLSHAVKAMTDHHLEIPIMSLAKKIEEFFLPNQSESIKLEEGNPTRLMIQHLRDEAHRFAIEYNRKLRKDDYTSSELEQIKGVGKLITQKLLRKYGSIENLKNIPEEELAGYIGAKLALKIKSNFK